MLAAGRWFSATLPEAVYYRDHFGEASFPITFVDVAARALESYRASNQPVGRWCSGGREGPMARQEFFLPRELAAQRRVVPPEIYQGMVTPASTLGPPAAAAAITHRNHALPDEIATAQIQGAQLRSAALVVDPPSLSS